MQIVPEVIKKVELAGARLLAVTKYFSPEETEKLLLALSKYPTVIGVGENRITAIQEKNIPRDYLHFIGNIQSRDIPEITKHCSVVHSLASMRHAKLFSEQAQIPAVFIQINISREEQKGGVMPEELGEFLSEISFLNLNILGLSAIGAGDFNEAQKRAEFRELVALRDKYLPNKSISAGTSRDYEIALEEGIDLVRIGKALFN